MPKYEIISGTVVIPGYVGPGPDYLWTKGQVKVKGDTVEMSEEDARGSGRHRLRLLEAETEMDTATASSPAPPPASPLPLFPPAPAPVLSTPVPSMPVSVPVSTSPSPPSRDWSFIATMPVPDASALIATVDNLADLQAIREAEISGRSGSGRTGVLGKILVRVSQLKNLSHVDNLE